MYLHREHVGNRLRHVDQMKAVAVLCMVEVHTAAIIPPEGITVGHPAAFIAAAFGGMAAPMFITLSGWGIYKSGLRKNNAKDKNWTKWILSRVCLLFICQIIVNIALNMDRGGRFYWQTPGVLTLLAIASLLTPIIIMMSNRIRTYMMLIMIVSPLLIGEYSGLEWSWSHRVDSQGVYEWIERLLWNGTYPATPWLGYIFLGSLIFDFQDKPETRDNVIKIGLVITVFSIFIAIIQKKAWALTSGNALLTFFPASSFFLVVSGTVVVLIMKILEGDEISGGKAKFSERLSSLEAVGRITLTIYVVHFIILGIAALLLIDKPRFGLFTAFSITIIHTLLWIPLANWHQKNIPNISFENLLRKIN